MSDLNSLKEKAELIIARMTSNIGLLEMQMDELKEVMILIQKRDVDEDIHITNGNV